MLSFIIPAHNEEAWIARSISAVRDSMVSVNEPYEVVVVDDASTDATASIAQQHGAQVIHVTHRMISATRNSGARQSRGDILFSWTPIPWSTPRSSNPPCAAFARVQSAAAARFDSKGICRFFGRSTIRCFRCGIA